MNRRDARILIVGGTGMLGSMVVREFADRGGVPVIVTQRRDPRAPYYFDAGYSPCDVAGMLEAAGSPRFVINCSGILNARIDISDSASVSKAMEVNARFPRRLAEAARQTETRVIHISTDAVFSGTPGWLDELAPTDPQDVYGRSKLEGELRDQHTLTLRCSILGPHADGSGLYEWLRLQPPGSVIRGFVDQTWNGVTTLQFARLCRAIVDEPVFDRLVSVSPLRHLCPNSATTKYELLRGLAAALGLAVTIEPVESGVPIDRTLRTRWNDLAPLLPTGDWHALLRDLVDADYRSRVVPLSWVLPNN